MHIKHNALLTSVHMYQVYCYIIPQYEKKQPSYVNKKKGYDHWYKQLVISLEYKGFL